MRLEREGNGLNVTWKALRTVAMVGLVVLFGGCVTNRMTIYVHPDGSGQIVVARLLDPVAVKEVVERRKAAAESSFEEGDPAPSRHVGDPFFDMRLLRREATMYGGGVKLADARRMDLDGGRGFVAIYSFANISDVCIVPAADRVLTAMCRSQSDLAKTGRRVVDVDGDAGGSDGKGIAFSMHTGVVSRLKIVLPWDEEKPVARTERDESDAVTVVSNRTDGKVENGDRDSMWFAPTAHGEDFWGDSFVSTRPGRAKPRRGKTDGVAVRLDVVIVGTVVSCSASLTNATFPNRLTLVDMDTTRNTGKDRRDDNRSFMYGLPSELTMNWLSRMEGAIVESNREVLVEFK